MSKNLSLSGSITVAQSDWQLELSYLNCRDQLIERVSKIPIADAAYALWINEETILITNMSVVEALQQAHRNSNGAECALQIRFASDFHSTLSKLFEQEYLISGDGDGSAAKATAQTRTLFPGFEEKTYIQAERYMWRDSDIVPVGKNSKGK